MKIVELKRVKKEKVGRINLNGIKPESQERKTMKLLSRYGLSIEVIRPTNTPKTNNPDILMLGTIWEMKAPTSFNENTLKLRMKKAAKQAGYVVFDLRNVKKNPDKVEKYIIELFTGNSRMRRMILIRKDGRAIDLLQ